MDLLTPLVALVSELHLHLLGFLDMPSIAAMERTTTLMRRAMRQAAERLNAMEGSEVVFDGTDEVVAWSRRIQWVRLRVRQREAGGVRVACGPQHSLVVTKGAVWSFGYGGDGQLGHGSDSDEFVPRLIKNLTNMKAVAAGARHSMALSMEGHVFILGYGLFAALGHDSNRLLPKKVDGIANVTSIAAGRGHCLAVARGHVYSWGWGRFGQLGLGDSSNRNVPTMVPGMGGVVAVEAGRFHSLALDRDGTLRSWGCNSHGQLGLGGQVDRSSPTVVAGLRRVVDVAGGGYGAIAVTVEGHVFTWGDYSGRVHAWNHEPVIHSTPSGVTAGLEGLVVVRVASGDNHCMAVTRGGQLLTWGWGVKGQLGHGRKEDEKAPRVVEGAGVVVGAAADSSHSVAVRESGEVVVFGEGGSSIWGVAPTVVDGRLGLGAAGAEALKPTVVKMGS